MTPELQQQLYTNYPEIFVYEGSTDPRQSCIAFGPEIGNGWYDLVDVLCYGLVSNLRGMQYQFEYAVKKQIPSSVIETMDPEKYTISPIKVEKLRLQMIEARDDVPRAVQVKEKFGGLRFYVTGGNKAHRALIEMAENMSFRICEECGDKSVRQQDQSGWITTLCAKHRKEHNSL